ncbi:MAG: cytochrome D1 domain-containing protein [Hyphomonas sp.]
MAICGLVLAYGLAGCGKVKAPVTEAGAQVIEREGLRVAFAVSPVGRPGEPVKAGEIARLSLQITNSQTGKPVSGLYPAAWIDPQSESEELTQESCRAAAGTYLSGYVGVRPMIDLNSYYLVVLNEDPTIAVIDPIVGIKGITKLLTQVILPARGEDWAPSLDQKKVFIALPTADAVSVLDLDTFRLTSTVNVGDKPNRITVQPDGRYVWIGRVGAEPGVTVLDAVTEKTVAQIETGEGHHELAFSRDNRFAFVSNRDSATVSVIDIRTLKKLRDISFDGAPISLAWSDLSEVLLVVDGEEGAVHAIEVPGGKTRSRLDLEAGLGPLRMMPGGRYGFVVNPSEDKVIVFDTATMREAHEIAVPGRPFQVSFSRNYAFVRSLESTRVSMIKLSDIGGKNVPTVTSFEAGERPPSEAPRLLPSDLFAGAVTEAATLAVSPGDATVYYYMEGMNAPMGSFRNYGHRPLSALVADRTIKEVSPGEYVSAVKIPASGDFKVILTMDSPQMIECFRFSAERNPLIEVDEAPLRIAFETRSGSIVRTGEATTVRFRLTDTARAGAPAIREDVRVLTYRAPGQDRTEQTVKPVGNGAYEVTFIPQQDGAHYVYPAVDALGLTYAKLPFLTVIARSDTLPVKGTP